MKDIKAVINYDMPGTAEDYVHRIGRCGRAGAQGVAYSFFTPNNGRLAKGIVGILEEAGQAVPPELRQFAAVSGGASGGGEPTLIRKWWPAISVLDLNESCLHDGCKQWRADHHDVLAATSADGSASCIVMPALLLSLLG